MLRSIQVCVLMALLAPIARPAGAQECHRESGLSSLGDPIAEATDAAGVVAPLPPCASRLMSRIYEATAPLAAQEGSNVDPGLLVTAANAASPRVLVRGPAIFGRKSELIAQAQREVTYQTFVWEPDSMPVQRLLRGVKKLEAQRRLHAAKGDPPVQVHILIDASDAGILAMPFPDGVQHVTQSLEDLDLDPRYVTYDVAAYPHALTGNLHSKVLVVDGQHAVVTGANPEAKHEGAHPWYDLGFEVSGEVATALRSELAEAWSHGVQWTCPNWPYYPESCTQPAQPLPELEPVRDGTVDADACVPMMIIDRDPDENPVSGNIDNTQDQAYLAAISSASRAIRIQTPNLNAEEVKQAIVDAAVRGVPTIEIMTSRDFNRTSESLPTVGGTNEDNVNELFERLRAAGVENPCERVQVRWFSEDGEKPVRGNGGGAAHAKYASFDDQVAIVGSTNMDRQSWYRSREVDIVVDDAATARAWDAVYEDAFGNGVAVEPCGGPRPLIAGPTWEDVLRNLSLQPRAPSPPLSFSAVTAGKQLGDWHLGISADRAQADETLVGDGADRLILGTTLTRPLARSLGLRSMARLEWGDDDLYRGESWQSGSLSVLQPVKTGSRARLELELGVGGFRETHEDQPALNRAELMAYAGTRFAWQIHHDLALRSDLAVRAPTRLDGVIELRSILSDDWSLLGAAEFRYDPRVWSSRGFDPVYRLSFSYNLPW